MRVLVSRHLENFLALYEARNMHVAAEHKGISQPALTKSLQLLESEFGATLFIRTSRGLEPTDAGNLLHRHASSMEQLARFASIDVAGNDSNAAGSLHIGVGPVLAISIFPQILAAFHKRFPRIEISVESAISNRLVDLLERGELDLFIAARLDDLPEDRYAAFPLFTSDMAVICRKDHPLMRRENVTLADLAEFERIGFPDDYEFEKKSSRAFGARSAALRPHLHTTSMAVMFGILSTSDHYAIVSNMMLPRARKDGLDHLAIGDELWQIKIELTCRLSLATSRPVTEMRRLFLSVAHET